MSNFKKWMTVIVIALLIWLLFLLSRVLVPFFIAAFLAYIGDPVVERFERLKLSRTFGVIVVFVIFIALIAIVILLLLPKIQHQAELLINLTPAFVDWFQKTLVNWANNHLGLKDLINPAHIKQNLSSGMLHIGTAINWLVKMLTHSSFAIVEFIITLVLIPVVTFYLMRDWRKLKSELRALIPRSKESNMIALANEANMVLGAFLRGQLMVMIALAIVYSIGLSLVGLNFALILGITIGLISVVPYLGSIVGLVLAVVMAAFQFNDGWYIFSVLIVFAVGHILEGMVLTPLLIGGRIGLHPVAVIFAVLAGGVLFGFFGVLLALPVATVIMVFVRYYRDQYLVSHLYTDGEHNE